MSPHTSISDLTDLEHAKRSANAGDIHLLAAGKCKGNQGHVPAQYRLQQQHLEVVQRGTIALPIDKSPEHNHRPYKHIRRS